MPRTRKNDKRERLIQAADKLIYEQTFHTTTLADIAKLADVPLGNVYYYFKTKEAIMDAVLYKRSKEWRLLFEQWEQQIPEVKQRLLALLAHNASHCEKLARFGCVMGSLCQELSKQGGILAEAAAKQMIEIFKWIEKQFIELGKKERAAQLASYFLSSLQGMNLLTLTFKEPQFIQRQNRSLQQWLSAL